MHNDRFGTIFEVLKTKAIRHRVREQDTETACGVLVNVTIGRKMPWGRWDLDHDLPKETRCKKCYPKTNKNKKRKPWPSTNSKKK